METILSYEEALAEVLRHAEDLPSPLAEIVALLQGRGRVLAVPIVADRDQPPFARSTRDGFAVRRANLEAGAGPLELVGSVRAGEQWGGGPLASGSAIEIMTGAPVPAGADAVLMLEHTEPAPPGLLQPAAGKRLALGENIVPAGAEARAGDALVPAGRLLGAAEVGLAASCGFAQVSVFQKPTVAILATGDELVEVREEPAEAQIRNSNSYALAALVEADGGTARRLPAARDTADDLRERLREGLASADLLLLSGGVSKGKYDLVEAALHEAGARFFFTGARIQPGKPVVFGHVPRPGGGDTFFFGLPGNPVSTEVCFRLFAAPLLRALSGHTARAPRFAEARLGEDVRGGAAVTRFLPAVVEGDWAGVRVRPVPWQGSGDLAANARANGFVVLPAGVPAFAAGESVRVLLR